MASTDDTPTASPFGRRWIISGAVVLLALALAVFLAVRGGVDKQPADSPAAATSAPPAATGEAVATPTATTASCKPPRTKDKGIPTEAPSVSWERHPSGGVVPVSKEHGPTAREGDAWRCSSRTASGALVGGLSRAYNFVTGDLTSGNDTPQRDSFFRANQLDASARLGTVEGYRIILSTDNEAVIEYLFSLDGKNAAMRVPLVWDESAQDWLLNTASNDLSMYQVTAPENYTKWR